MMRRLFDKIFGFLGIGYGWCGGCGDPDCMDCVVEWSDESRRDAYEREVLGDQTKKPSGIGGTFDPIEPVEYDGFGAPVYPYQIDDGR